MHYSSHPGWSGTMKFHRSGITFRPLQSDDLLRMYHWLRDTDVSRWYGAEPETLAEVEMKYLARISGEEPVQCYIVSYQDQPVAYIQWYRIDHDANYAAALAVDPDAAGVDLFIGETHFRYQGFGSLLLQEFLRGIVFSDPTISCCVIAPTPSNTSAIRAYQKAGFRHIKTVDVPGEPEQEFVMIIWPDELETLLIAEGVANE
jgi:RimJ/RimL family protein N-acetyltransferase